GGRAANGARLAVVATPAEAVAFLKARLKPVAAPDPARLEKLLENLDAKSFKVRQEAMTELEKLGDLAADAIQKKLAGKLSLEVRQRVEWLRDKLGAPLSPGPLLQAGRAPEVLEDI